MPSLGLAFTLENPKSSDAIMSTKKSMQDQPERKPWITDDVEGTSAPHKFHILRQIFRTLHAAKIGFVMCWLIVKVISSKYFSCLLPS